jgi:putative membrane protein
MMGGYGMMAGLGWMGMLVMALFWIGVLMLVVWGLSKAFATQQPRITIDPEEILKQRYARGEISREELTQAREVLAK